MMSLAQDFRFAVRQLRRHPGFMAAAVGTLALGIGANTAIFSAVHRALLRPLPFSAPDELRLVRPILSDPQGSTDTLWSWSYPMYEAFRDAEPGLASIAAFTPRAHAYNLAGPEEPQRVLVEFASASYFPVLGIRAAVGRTFLAEEDRIPNEAAVAVLGHEFWRTRYGADSSIVGRTISLNSITFTVVGVLPSGFSGLSRQADIWVPMMMSPALTFPRRLTGALSFWHAVIGRVSPGETDARLATRMGSAARSVEDRLPLAEGFGDVTLGFTASPLTEVMIDPSVRNALKVLIGAVVFLLLIVAVNVANMLLTRAARRRRELGIRVALGAGRRDLARQLVVESGILGLLGGAGALLIAVWGLDLLEWLQPPAFRATADLGGIGLDGTTVLFNFVLAAFVGIAIGLVPAFWTPRDDLQRLLKEGSRTVASRAGSRRILVAFEVAVAVVLLAGAGLMLRSLDRLNDVPLGFDATGLLTANVELPRQSYASEAVPRFLAEVRGRMAALPGVVSANAANCLPLTGFCDRPSMEIEGRVRAAEEPPLPVWTNMVDGDHFRTLRIPLIAGRTFTPVDGPDAPRVAIINEAAAREYWPGANPIGRRIQLSFGWEDWAEIVGVVGDTRQSSVEEPPEPGVYLPHAQWSYRSNYLVLRTAGDPIAYTEALRNIVREIDPALPLWDIQTMEERIAAATAPTRFSAILLTLAAALAMFLSALGVFGVTAFSVAGRTREFGMRMALGARSEDVVRLVLGQGMRMAVAGLLVGVIASIFLTRVLTSQLYGIAPEDPVAIGGAALLLALVAVGASYLPARRASRIDPVEALRYE